MELTIKQTLQQGIVAHKEGRIKDAERLYNTILQSQPLHPDANHNLGLLGLLANKPDTSLLLFKTALEANPKVEQFWISYIDTLIKENQLESAKQALEQCKASGFLGDKLNTLEDKLLRLDDISSPSHIELKNLLTHYQNKRFDDAKKLAVSLTKEFPEHQFGWKVLGAVLKQVGRVSESLAAMQKSVQLAPQDHEAHFSLGNMLQELGRLQEAEESYSKTIALKPDLAPAYNNLGVTLKEQSRFVESKASYSKAIALKPDYAEAHNNLGNILRELGRLDEAEASCRQAIVHKPEYPKAFSNLGVTLQEMGKLEESESHFRRAITLSPGYAEAHNNLGFTLKELGRQDEAEASYNQAIALQQNFTIALMNRWQLLFDRRKFDAALKDADLCNTHESRACSLETLYALGRIDEIYKRIEMQSDLDEGNIRAAAFSSFISEREKKDTAHKFCRNPLSFIHIFNISSHAEDANKFVTGVIEELNKEETIWEPEGKSTINGFQSLPYNNLFVNPPEKMAQLKSLILNELDAYYLKFKNESCSFIKKWPSKKNLRGWHVILKKQGFQTSHIHVGGWLSGVIYLKVVPPLKKDEGAIEFSLNSKNYSDSKSPRLLHQPAPGDIVFFPSSLHHKTIPFTTDTDRIIVSFDLLPRLEDV